MTTEATTANAPPTPTPEPPRSPMADLYDKIASSVGEAVEAASSAADSVSSYSMDRAMETLESALEDAVSAARSDAEQAVSAVVEETVELVLNDAIDGAHRAVDEAMGPWVNAERASGDPRRSAPTTVQETADMQETLRRTILPWMTDNSHPPRFIRLNGLGGRIAVVDPWVGGFCDPDGRTVAVRASLRIGLALAVQEICTRDSMEAALDAGMETVDLFLSRHPLKPLLVPPNDAHGRTVAAMVPGAIFDSGRGPAAHALARG